MGGTGECVLEGLCLWWLVDDERPGGDGVCVELGRDRE
jgi:hypothetical protein